MPLVYENVRASINAPHYASPQFFPLDNTEERCPPRKFRKALGVTPDSAKGYFDVLTELTEGKRPPRYTANSVFVSLQRCQTIASPRLCHQ